MAQLMKGSTGQKQTNPCMTQQGAGFVGGAVHKATSPVSSQGPGSRGPRLVPARGAPGVRASEGLTPNTPGVLSVSFLSGSHEVAAANGNVAVSTSDGGSGIISDQTGDSEGNMANTKEKTPMCLINELARFNKIPHQYTLTDEQGPAHKKTFYVKLNLGDETYNAAGPSIKKAQHAGAAIALQETKYKHPPPKSRNKVAGKNGLCVTDSITPTVELNALAMKRGEPAEYRAIEPRPQNYYPCANLDFRGMYNQRYHYPRCQRVYYVSLKVGPREFIGEGQSRQEARHDAASKALTILRKLPTTASKAAKKAEETQTEEDENKDALKSEISLVHEIALKRNMPVNFEVIKESGPPHMKTFVTQCIVGNLNTEGDGNGKKISKKRAAEKMLNKLKDLPTIPTVVNKPKRPNNNKKKNKNLIKEQKADPYYGVGINPISRLIQIQQAKKEKEPIYTLLTEKGVARRREFVIQVQVGTETCVGEGPNKKLAKRNAAEAMLQHLGYSRPAPQPSKPAIKSNDTQQPGGAGDKKVTFIDQEGNTSRQLVPGVLLMPDASSTQQGPSFTPGQGYGRGVGVVLPTQVSAQTTAAIAQELLDKGSSPTAEAIVKSGAKPLTSASVVRPKQQLLYLADVLGFQVQFTDFPKTNKMLQEYLSLVSLSTNPPQVSHGSGATLEESQDMASLTALQCLAELGLDKVSEKKPAADPEKMAGGDGPAVQSEPGMEKLANSGCGDVSTTINVKKE